MHRVCLGSDRALSGTWEPARNRAASLQDAPASDQNERDETAARYQRGAVYDIDA